MKALEKDRGRRYETASAFAADIQHYLNDEPVTACPPSAAYKFRKFARRNKLVIGTTAAITATLIVGIITTSWQAYRATKAEGIAEDRLGIVESQKKEISKERQKAVSEARRAEQEVAIANAVHRFLNDDLLGMGRPEAQAEAKMSPDPNIKLRTLLDRAAKSIEGRFSDQPLEEAAIRQTLGATFSSIGAYDEAEKHLQRALQLRRQKLGSEHSDTLDSMGSLGVLYWNQGRYSEAESLAQRTLEIRRRKLGEEHPSTLVEAIRLGNVYADEGRYDEAENLFDQTLHVRLQTLGKEHPDTLWSMSNLAMIYGKQGRYADAEKLGEQTLEIRRRTLGDEHPATLVSMNNQAATYGSQGRFDEAEKQYLKTLEIERRTLGTEHPLTLLTMYNLASVYTEQVRYDEAEKLLRETLELQRRTLGEEHPQTLASMNLLAIVYRKEQRYEDAEKLHRQTLNIRRQTLGPKHADTLGSMYNLALVLTDRGHYAEAEQLLRETLQLQRRTLGEEHPETLKSLTGLSYLFGEQGRYKEAAQLGHEILQIQQRTQGKEHPDTLISMNNLAVTYDAQRRYREAAKLQQQTLKLYQQTLGDEHPNTVRSMYNLALVHRHMGHNDEAERLYLKALEILQRTRPKDFPFTKLVKSRLVSLCENRAWVLATTAKLEERDPAEAIRLAQQAVDLAPENANNWDNLGVALCSQKEYEQAIEALENARQMRGGKDENHQIFLATAYAKVGRTDEALAEYLQNGNWLAAKRQPADQYRFRNEAEDVIGLDQLSKFFSEKLQQGPFDLATARLYIDLLLRHQRVDEAVQFCQVSLEQDDLSSEERRAICQEIVKVDELFTLLAELRSDDRGLWLARADYLARTNHWAGAAEAYGRIKFTEPLAAALLLSRDEEGYRTVCSAQIAALQRQKTPKPGFYRMIAELCSYSDAAEFDRNQILEWAQQAAEADTSKFTLHTLGCALYRAGEFARAAQVFEQANERPDAVKSNNAFPLAIVYHYLGNSLEARRWYDYGLQEMKRARPNTSSVAGWAPGHWLSVNLWHREAAKVIGEYPLIAPRPEPIENTPRARVAEIEESTTHPATVGQKE